MRWYWAASASTRAGESAIARSPSSLLDTATRNTPSTRFDVAPAQAQQLEAAKSGQHQRQEHRPRLLVGERREHATDLGRLEDPPAAPLDLRALTPVDRVRVDELLGVARSCRCM